MKKTMIGVRLSDDMAQDLKHRAVDARKSLSSYVEGILVSYLKKGKRHGRKTAKTKR